MIYPMFSIFYFFFRKLKEIIASFSTFIIISIAQVISKLFQEISEQIIKFLCFIRDYFHKIISLNYQEL